MSYLFLLHADTADDLRVYRQHLAEQGLSDAGAHLRAALQVNHPAIMDDEAFLEALVNTKHPQIFAESAVYGDGRDWNATELTLLGDLGVAAGVHVFDDGRHAQPRVHPKPLAGTLLFIPGALLRNGRGCTPADWAAVTDANERIDPDGYQALYERRLLPLLLHASAEATAMGQDGVVTIPGLGCGQFAGPFAGMLGEQLKAALIALLERHAERLTGLRAIYYDPFNECRNERRDFGSLSLRVRPLLEGNDRPQLCAPADYAEAGEDFSTCLLYSVVAWDHVSWPGNDFWGGDRATDDGVKAAATDVMRVLTGVEGRYDPAYNIYAPPPPWQTWEALAAAQSMRLSVVGRLRILR